MENTAHGGIQEMLNQTFDDNTEQTLVQGNIPQGINQLNSLAQIGNGFSAQAKTTVTTGTKTLWRLDCRVSLDGRKSYVATVMLHKYDPSVNGVVNAINVAKNKGVQDFGSNWSCNFNPLHDGDKETPQNARPENYKGKYYLYARSNVQPIIVNSKGDLLQDNEKVYVNLSASLYEGSVAMRFFPYNNQNSGVSCSLVVLMAAKVASQLTGDRATAFAKNVFSEYLNQ